MSFFSPADLAILAEASAVAKKQADDHRELETEKIKVSAKAKDGAAKKKK